MSPMTAYSIICQLARMVPAPRRHSANRRSPSASGGEQFGRCPACREFIGLKTSKSGQVAVCPACGESVDAVESLFPSAGEP